DWEGGFGQVTASQGGLVGVGKGEEAVEETVEPVAGELARQAEREEGGDGTGTHRGQIAEPAHQGTMTDGFRRVPVERKMAAGDGKIGGQRQLLAGPEAKQGAIVADAEAQRRECFSAG